MNEERLMQGFNADVHRLMKRIPKQNYSVLLTTTVITASCKYQVEHENACKVIIHA